MKVTLIKLLVNVGALLAIIVNEKVEYTIRLVPSLSPTFMLNIPVVSDKEGIIKS